MIGFNFNTLFEDPIKNLKAARYALQRTELGRSGLLRVDLDGEQKITYTLITSGQKFLDYGEAFAKASSEMITKFNVIKPLTKEGGINKVSLNSPFNPRVAQTAEFLTAINDKKVLKDLEAHRGQLIKLGMEESEIDELIRGDRQIGIQLSQLKDQTDVRNYAKDFINRQMKKVGLENYFPFIDKDGANILRFTSFTKDAERNLYQFTNNIYTKCAWFFNARFRSIERSIWRSKNNRRVSSKTSKKI